ncbi:MAG: prepilin-type N-terminal cleavage/methylation domain-containing protein [Patescibacteria group bacterium]
MRSSIGTGQRGFTLVEAVVAMTVFVIGVVALVQITLLAKSTSEEGRDTVQAVNYLQEGIEAVRSIRDHDWELVAGPAPGTDYRLHAQPGTAPPWTLTEGSEAIGEYTRTVRFEDVHREDSDGSGTLTAGDRICTGSNCGQFDDPDTRRTTVTVTWEQGNRTVTRSLYAYLTNWQ